MGSLFSGSQKTTTNEQTDTGPSKFQLPYLTDAFNAAQSNFKGQGGSPFYQGDLYAGMSDSAKSDLDASKNYATGTGLATANQLSQLGSSLAGFGGKAASTLDDYLTLANGDATAANIKAASSYASNPYLDSQIDAVNRDVGRNLAEVTLPGIDRAASGSGNINSSRAGVASGIAQRGAADRMADNAASLRSQAYSQGLNLAQQDRAQQLNAMGTASQAYQGLAGMGINALNAGTQAGYGAYNVVNQANAMEQADRQGQADADYATWQGNDTRQSDLLSRYMSIIGGNQWGQSGTSSGTSVSKSTPSLLQTAIGLGTMAAGF